MIMENGCLVLVIEIIPANEMVSIILNLFNFSVYVLNSYHLYKMSIYRCGEATKTQTKLPTVAGDGDRDV